MPEKLYSLLTNFEGLCYFLFMTSTRFCFGSPNAVLVGQQLLLQCEVHLYTKTKRQIQRQIQRQRWIQRQSQKDKYKDIWGGFWGLGWLLRQTRSVAGRVFLLLLVAAEKISLPGNDIHPISYISNASRTCVFSNCIFLLFCLCKMATQLYCFLLLLPLHSGLVLSSASTLAYPISLLSGCWNRWSTQKSKYKYRDHLVGD